MARIDPIPRAQMTAEQIRVNDAITGVRAGGQAGGPFAIWVRDPAFAEIAGEFGIYLRTKTTLPPRTPSGTRRADHGAQLDGTVRMVGP